MVKHVIIRVKSNVVIAAMEVRANAPVAIVGIANIVKRAEVVDPVFAKLPPMQNCRRVIKYPILAGHRCQMDVRVRLATIPRGARIQVF